MSPMQYRHRREYEQVLKYTEQLHSLMESGEFWDLSFFERRKLVRRVNKLYRRLAGIFALGPTKTALLAAGVLALTACPSNGAGDTGDGDGDGDDPTTGNVTISIDGTAIDDLVADALDSLTFSAEIVDFNGDPSYQWFYDGDALEGETNATLSFIPPKTINTTGLEDFYSPRGGAPNLHELKVEVTDSETAEIFTATVDLTVRIDPEFSATWEPMPVGLYWYFANNGFTNVLFGDLDADGDADALSINQYVGGGYYGDFAVFFERADTADLSFSYYGETGLYTYERYGDWMDGYTTIRMRPTELMDLDGDGDADLVLGTYTYYDSGYMTYDHTVSFGFSVFENTSVNNSPPVFERADVLSVPGIDATGTTVSYTEDSGWPYDVFSDISKRVPSAKFLDLDADGDLDLLVSRVEYDGGNKRVITMQENIGTLSSPSFDSPVELFSGADLFDYPLLSAGDIDLDGDVDIFVSEPTITGDGLYNADFSAIKLFINSGTPISPSFTESSDTKPLGFDFNSQIYDYAPPLSPYEITIVDLDGDGDLDVVTGWYDAYYGYAPIAFFNDATGSTTRPDWINEDFPIPE